MNSGSLKTYFSLFYRVPSIYYLDNINLNIPQMSNSMLYNEYIPKTFDDSIIHKNIIKKLKNIKELRENIILYGPNGSGKYVLALMLLENIFGKEIYTQNENVITTGNKSFTLYSSNYHYELYLKNSYIKYSEINNIIETLGKNRNIVNNGKNVILIKNSQYLNNENLFLIKKSIEKQKLYFILTTNQLNSLFSGLNSIFMCLRIPCIDSKELLTLVKEIKKKEKIKIYVKDIKEIISNNKSNLIQILYNLKIYSLTGNCNYENILHTKLDKILELVYKKKEENIIPIRKLLYNVCTHNISRYEILKYCFNDAVNKLDIPQKKIDLLKFTNEINIKLANSFKTTIHIEYYLIHLMSIIK